MLSIAGYTGFPEEAKALGANGTLVMWKCQGERRGVLWTLAEVDSWDSESTNPDQYFISSNQCDCDSTGWLN